MKGGAEPRLDSIAFVGRGGHKLAFALGAVGLDVLGLVAADLGSHVGGFVDCLLARGAKRVHAVDTCYGTLAWKLRNDPRVAVHERTNALHFSLPEPVDVVSIDVGWTPQDRILPVAQRLLVPGGSILSLVKPQYEARKSELDRGFVRPEALDGVLERVASHVARMGWGETRLVECPLGGGARNREYFIYLRRPALGLGSGYSQQ